MIKKYLFFILIFVAFIGILILDKDRVNEENTINSLCTNSDEVKTFSEPVPVVWEARFNSCLVSCYGASFTRISDETKFAGYYPDNSGKYAYKADAGSQIPNEFTSGETIKIYGDWIGIEEDHSKTVFDSKCVPIVNIKKIEKNEKI